MVGANLGAWQWSWGQPWEGDELTQIAQETFDSRVRAVNSRQHLVQIWFALQEQQGKTFYGCRVNGPD